jgi:hypothetical protein
MTSAHNRAVAAVALGHETTRVYVVYSEFVFM